MSEMYSVVYDSNHLAHYGRLGMKWGQQIFGRESMLSKTAKGLDRREKRVMNQGAKYDKAIDSNQKYLYKATKAKYKRESRGEWRPSRAEMKYAKVSAKAQKKQYKVNKAINKRNKYEEAMIQNFGEKTVSQLKKDKQLGYSYVYSSKFSPRVGW